MPQMLPMNWIILFMMFFLIFLLFNIMNYYIYLNKKKIIKSNMNNNFKKMNWKW